MRKELDLRFGAAFTRAETLFISHFVGKSLMKEKLGGKGFISYGPCQFPTLGFVVKRCEEIRLF
jgi:DNA topoisomerase-3